MNKKNSWILKGGRIIDPANHTDRNGDLWIRDGRIVEPGSFDPSLDETETINLKGLVVAPGLIDMHVHLRQPGNTDAETIRTGTMAAAAGGFTTIVAMPNTSPCADNAGTIQYIKEYSAREGVVKVLPSGALSVGRKGEEMTPVGSLKAAGVVALTDDGCCIQNNELMRHVVEYAGNFGLPILEHCEDKFLAGDGVMHEGYWSVLLGMKAMPAAAEEVIVARDIILSRLANWKIHIQHVSSRNSVRMIRSAQADGVRISAEATPHHIALTDVEIKKFDTNYKMNPPLRAEEDRMAVIEGLQDGTIAVIATDHAPHTQTAKLVEFDHAPFGIIGLETAIPVVLTELYHKNYLSLSQVISKFTVGPATILGINAGTLSPGAPADVTVIDPECDYIVDVNDFYSKSRNTPFNGYAAKGRTMATFVDGVCVFSLLKESDSEDEESR
jgi:dihydroorotase